jgi:DDE superfamily endonuclease
MLILPVDIMRLLTHFAPVFSRRVWRHVPLLVVGALLAPGRRMVSSVLRTMGQDQTPTFQTYHRVLHRAVWSSLKVSRILLHLLIATFIPDDSLVVGIDETIERRRGKKIAAAGIYRDPVRSSHSHFVKVNGLRWISLMLLVPIPWAGRVWALPFLTALAPSERYAQERHRRHKPVTTWARQLIRLVHRWLPDRHLVIVGDRGYATLDLLDAVRPVATFITRLRLDAHLCAPPPPRTPRQIGRPRVVGKRLPTLEQWRDDAATEWTTLTVSRWYGEAQREVEIVSQTAIWYHTGLPPVPIRWVLIRDPQGKFFTQALLCTDLEATPLQILSWFVLRWQMEVTFHAARAHLGVETQRQWSERAIAIARTTPALLGLFSLVTLLAHEPMMVSQSALPHAAWYSKVTPTFSDALALVRRRLWTQMSFPTLTNDADVGKVPRTLLDHLADLLCYAA